MLTVSFSSSVIAFAKKAKLCWKYLIVSIKATSLPMLAKLMLVGILAPLEMSLVLKKIETKKIMCNHAYLYFLFP